MEFNGELLRFITNIQIASDGTVPLNTLDTAIRFESEYYTPLYSVSLLSKLTIDKIKRGEIKEGNITLEKHTLTYQAINSDLPAYAPNIYLLVRLVVLECFSLVYAVNEDRDNIEYISKKDFKRVKGNLNYLADFMGTEEKYHRMVGTVRMMVIALGYIEHQTDVIMNYRRARG